MLRPTACFENCADGRAINDGQKDGDYNDGRARGDHVKSGVTMVAAAIVLNGV
jgi:hypothetical protein